MGFWSFLSRRCLSRDLRSTFVTLREEGVVAADDDGGWLITRFLFLLVTSVVAFLNSSVCLSDSVSLP